MRLQQKPRGSLPPLTWLRAFEAAARHSSFKLAAEELNVTPAAISQQVRSLEEFYDIKLFVRQTRALELTRVGALSAPLMSRALDLFSEACDVIRDDMQRDWLTLTAPFTFCIKWLMPQLERFNEAYPAIEIRLSATDELVDLNQGEADIGIRYGDGDYPDLDTQKLICGDYDVVASPEVLSRNGGIDDVAGLLGQTLLHTDWRGRPDVVPSWEMWLKSSGVNFTEPISSKGHKFSNEMMSIDAAVAGLGIALVSNANAHEDLKAERLVRVFDDAHLPTSRFDYYIVRPGTGNSSRSAAILHDWLCREAAANT